MKKWICLCLIMLLCAAACAMLAEGEALPANDEPPVEKNLTHGMFEAAGPIEEKTVALPDGTERVEQYQNAYCTACHELARVMISPSVEDILHTGYGEAVPSACEHPLYEVSGPVLDDTYVDLDSMHLHAASQSAFCVSCGREILVLLAPSAVESHAWAAYTDVHVSDLEHFYFERCKLCGAVAYYSRPCYGYHE